MNLGAHELACSQRCHMLNFLYPKALAVLLLLGIATLEELKTGEGERIPVGCIASSK